MRCINQRPIINLPKVPEFSELIVIFFLYCSHLGPLPMIVQLFLFNFTFAPSFLTALIAAKTSSDKSKL